MRAGIYIHIPFCQVRCSYCDFNTYAGLEGLIPAYTRALCTEVDQVRREALEAGLGRVEVDTLFLGGGTPSSCRSSKSRRSSTWFARPSM